MNQGSPALICWLQRINPNSLLFLESLKTLTTESNLLRLFRKKQKVVSACLPATSSRQVRYAQDAVCTQMVSPNKTTAKPTALCGVLTETESITEPTA